MKYISIILLFICFFAKSETLYKYVNGVRVEMTQQETIEYLNQQKNDSISQAKQKEADLQKQIAEKNAQEQKTKTLILPVMTQTDISMIALPETGRVIFNKTTGKIQIYNGLNWTILQ